MVEMDSEANDQASEVMEGMPSPVFHNKPMQNKKRRPRNKNLEINPSLETAIPQFILQDVPGVKPKKKKRKRNKSKKPAGSGEKVAKKLPIESIKENFIEVKYSLQYNSNHDSVRSVSDSVNLCFYRV